MKKYVLILALLSLRFSAICQSNDSDSTTNRFENFMNELYEDWMNAFTQCPVLIINTDNLDLVSSPQHVDQVVCWVQNKLTGRTEVKL